MGLIIHYGKIGFVKNIEIKGKNYSLPMYLPDATRAVVIRENSILGKEFLI